MDLTKNIIPEEKFNNLILALFTLISVSIFWNGYNEYNDLSKVLNCESASKLERLEFDTKYLKVSKAYLEDSSNHKINYVTVLALESTPSDVTEEKVLESNFGFSKMTGLISHPSFLINNDSESFWKSQIYLEFFYGFGSMLIICVFLIALLRINEKKQNRIFSKEIGKTFNYFTALLLVSFFLDMLIYGRLMVFLNETYYLGESITGGGSQLKLFIAAIFIFLGNVIQRGNTLQEEQDLTI
ncbi:MAG: DUF2975 domain-containing protein [Balneola sp.]